MNLLGRLFIVLIFIGSIMLMAFSVALYSTHTNWREHANRLDETLRQKTQEFAELQRQKDTMEAALNLEIRRQASQNLALATTVRQLSQDNTEARDDIAELREQLAMQVATVRTALEETGRLRARLDGASRALLDAQNEWAAMSTEIIRKTDEAHGLAIQVANYQSVSTRLAEDYRDAVNVLRSLGISTADMALFGSQPPTGIRGTVTEVRPGGIIEISIGSDSGLVRGHHLDIVRNREGRSAYIGKIEITNVAADRAVARVMPEFRRGVVQRNDEVTYIDVNELVAH